MTNPEELPAVDATIDYANGYVDALKDCKEAEVAALIMERDGLTVKLAVERASAAVSIAALQAENDRFKEALKPFAEHGDQFAWADATSTPFADEFVIATTTATCLKLLDFRRARAALSMESKG